MAEGELERKSSAMGTMLVELGGMATGRRDRA